MKSALLAALVTTALGCATEEEVPTFGDGLGTPENPIPHEDSYTVVSRISLAVDSTLLDKTLADLRMFSTNPARALLVQAQDSNLAALQKLNAELSLALKDRLEGWINTEIDKVRIAGVTLRQFGSDMTSAAQTTLTQFQLESSLKISPTGVTHALTAINFKPNGRDIIVPIGGLKADTLTQTTTATVAEAGALTLGTQSFGLAFGNHAWQGINLASTALFGADLNTAMKSALNCTAIAQTVASKCYNGYCVGHATELKGICEGAVDALTAELRTQATAVTLDVFRFTAGSAKLVDENGDGLAERMIDGTWSVESNMGTGLRTAAAPFTATRLR